MYEDPVKFREFVAKCACICFTATPDDQDPKGVDTMVLKAMSFQQFFYVLEKVDQKVQLNFDRELPAMSNEDKVKEITTLSLSGPVLVYCQDALNTLLKQAGLQLLEVNDQVDHNELKTLATKEKDQYRVVVATTS